MTADVAHRCRWCPNDLSDNGICPHCDRLCQARECQVCGRAIIDTATKRRPEPPR